VPSGRPEPVLSLVMPVYDEGEAIGDVLTAWDDEAARLGLAYELLVYDDGSRDGSPAIMDRVAAARPNVCVIRQTNRGHGPTILRGYHEARGDWVFQVDGDDEVSPEWFPHIWRNRDADLVLGYRVGRDATRLRKVVTALSRWTVLLLFRTRLRDVNTPYRLYRRSLLVRLLPFVPPDAFAPNVILTGLAGRAGARIVEIAVPHRRRRARTGQARLRIAPAVARSFAQAARVAIRANGRLPPLDGRTA